MEARGVATHKNGNARVLDISRERVGWTKIQMIKDRLVQITSQPIEDMAGWEYRTDIAAETMWTLLVGRVDARYDTATRAVRMRITADTRKTIR